MKRFYAFIVLVSLILSTSLLQSCKDNGNNFGETKYTVWTETDTYSDFVAAFNTTLKDGYYVRVEFTKSQWEQIFPYLTSEGRHSWTEESIKKWLVANGFGESESTKESSWFALIDHGFLAARDGNLVYYIMK